MKILVGMNSIVSPNEQLGRRIHCKFKFKATTQKTKIFFSFIVFL